MLPAKALLRAKLHEFYQRLAPPEIGADIANPPRRGRNAERGKKKAGT